VHKNFHQTHDSVQKCRRDIHRDMIPYVQYASQIMEKYVKIDNCVGLFFYIL